MALGIFLLGEDTIEKVREIRTKAIQELGGQLVSWSSESTTVQKVAGLKPAEKIDECNYFLRLNDPKIKRNNPFRDRTKPFLV